MLTLTEGLWLLVLFCQWGGKSYKRSCEGAEQRRLTKHSKGYSIPYDVMLSHKTSLVEELLLLWTGCQLVGHQQAGGEQLCCLLTLLLLFLFVLFVVVCFILFCLFSLFKLSLMHEFFLFFFSQFSLPPPWNRVSKHLWHLASCPVKPQ